MQWDLANCHMLMLSPTIQTRSIHGLGMGQSCCRFEINTLSNYSTCSDTVTRYILCPHSWVSARGLFGMCLHVLPQCPGQAEHASSACLCTPHSNHEVMHAVTTNMCKVVMLPLPKGERWSEGSPLAQSWKIYTTTSHLRKDLISVCKKQVCPVWPKRWQGQTCFLHTLESEKPHLSLMTALHIRTLRSTCTHTPCQYYRLCCSCPQLCSWSGWSVRSGKLTSICCRSVASDFCRMSGANAESSFSNCIPPDEEEDKRRMNEETMCVCKWDTGTYKHTHTHTWACTHACTHMLTLSRLPSSLSICLFSLSQALSVSAAHKANASILEWGQVSSHTTGVQSTQTHTGVQLLTHTYIRTYVHMSYTECNSIHTKVHTHINIHT